MKEAFNPANLWFTRTFEEEKKPKRKIYEGFCEGYVAYHDIHIDKVDWNDPSERHRLEFDWKNNYKAVDVYIYPFSGKSSNSETLGVQTSSLYGETHSLTASVTVYAASSAISDPPVPPPPPPPSGF
jgi:hypothetical protein